MKKATISTLRHFPNKIKEEYIQELIDFVAQIKSQTNQMATGCFIHKGNLTQDKNAEMIKRIDALCVRQAGPSSFGALYPAG